MYTLIVKKKRLISIFALSVLLVSCLGWILEKPTFIVHEISLKPRSLTEMNLLLSLEIQNPNRFDLTLTFFEYIVSLDNKEIGNGRLQKELLIPSSSTTQAQIPVVAKFKDVGRSLKAIITNDALPYKIEGTAEIKTALGSLKFPFLKEGHINLKM